VFSKFINAQTKQVVLVNHSHIVRVEVDSPGPGSRLILDHGDDVHLDIDVDTVARLLRGDQDQP
jgi:uncharacterized protein YfaT (DUF1175 family)